MAEVQEVVVITGFEECGCRRVEDHQDVDVVAPPGRFGPRAEK
jgi:hypothetical protein